MSIFGSGSCEAELPGPGSSTRVIRRARPVVSSISISAPRSRTSPEATGNDAGRFETKRFRIGSIARPRIAYTGHHIHHPARTGAPHSVTLLVRYMASGRDDGNAGAQTLDCVFARDPSAACCVLAVDDDEIQCLLFLKPRQPADHGVAPWFAHDVAQKKNR